MAQPKWSAAEESAMRDSHSDLINQVFSSAIGARPPATLARSSSSVSKSCSSSTAFDAIMMQDLFNELDVVRKARERGYRVEWKHWRPTPPHILPEAISVTLRFFSPLRTVIFDVHAYLTAGVHPVEIQRSQLLDPKHIIFHETIRVYVGDQSP